MANVELTGPVKFQPETAGPFEAVEPETKQMSTTVTARAPHDLDLAFTGRPQEILEELCDDDVPSLAPQPPTQTESYELVNANEWDEQDSPWEVEVRGSITNRLYEAACVVADEAGDVSGTSYKRSPITVLLRWGKSGRYRGNNDSPLSAAEAAMESLVGRNDAVEDYFETPDWDEVQTGYDAFQSDAR